MKIASKVASLGKCLARLHLDALLTLSDIEEAWEGAINVRIYVFPRLDVEDRIAFTDLPDKDPFFELADFLVWPIGILWHRWHRLVSNWAHVVIVAMIDVGLVLRPETLLEIFESRR